jgi:hypothetical protein
MPRTLIACCLLLCVLASMPAAAKAPPVQVVVKDPYVDLHTGPGRGFPVAISVERGVTIELLRQRTDWIEVRTPRGQRGWVNRAQLVGTLTPEGGEIHLAGPEPDARTNHKWEVGFAAGQFGGASLVSLNGAYLLTDSLLLRGDVSQVLGNYSNGWLGTIGIAHLFMPQWRISPLVGIGGGMLHVTPKATLVNTSDRNDTAAYAAVGVRGYLSDRFLLQGEYRSFVVFVKRDDNQEIDEWLLGFTYFF